MAILPYAQAKFLIFQVAQRTGAERDQAAKGILPEIVGANSALVTMRSGNASGEYQLLFAAGQT